MNKSIVAFVPAIHTGYINFFKKYPHQLYILGQSFVEEFPKLKRDLRQPDFRKIKQALESLKIFQEINILEVGANLPTVDIVMPDEDVSRAVAQRFFSDKNITFEPTFLRWDKQITLRENEISPNRIISEDQFDRELMMEVEEEAKKSSDWWRQIGAFLTKDGKIIFKSHNRHLPTDYNLDLYGDPRSNFDAGERFDLSTAIHAEAQIVAEAAKKGVAIDGALLYLSTFPCPTCAKLIAEAGIKKVYYKKGYSLLDAEDILKSYNVEIILVR